MDQSFVITTESNSEIPFSWEDETGVRVLRMPYTVNGQEYYYDLGRETDIPAFYKMMREGASVITAQRNPIEIVEYWEPYLLAGKDILHIAFSSALSGTFNCEQLAAEELRGKYPERRIELVDSLAISAPLALLVEKAIKLQREGKTLDEIRDWVQTHKQYACALFMVDDLEYLRRGGRVSGAAAFFGSVLEIKPILYESPEGQLVPIEKAKGRRRAMKFLVDRCAAVIERADEQDIILCQADCPDDAKTLYDMTMEAVHPRSIRIHPVGPVIGCHCGPGTLALVFFGRSRAALKG